MKALIVDDEMHCRKNLSILLNEHCQQITEIRTAGSVDEAYREFDSFKPDLLFLDIQMPEKDGFDLLAKIDPSFFSLIFVTAHDEYALQAIRSGPVAYLLKPIDIDELKEAVDLAEEQLVNKFQHQIVYTETLRELRQAYKKRRPPDKICLAHQTKLQIVNVCDIVLLVSQGFYTIISMVNGEEIVMAKTLKTYEDIFGEQFIRVHRSSLVNKDYIVEYDFENNDLLVSSGQRVRVSRRKAHQVVEFLRSIS